jgi:hypothetical protein
MQKATPEAIAWAQKLLSDDEIVEVFITLDFFSVVARMTIGLRAQQEPPPFSMFRTWTSTLRFESRKFGRY